MEISFHGKRALVTGAGQGEFFSGFAAVLRFISGIGREISKALAKGGAAVVGVDKNQEFLRKYQRSL